MQGLGSSTSPCISSLLPSRVEMYQQGQTATKDDGCGNGQLCSVIRRTTAKWQKNALRTPHPHLNLPQFLDSILLMVLLAALYDVCAHVRRSWCRLIKFPVSEYQTYSDYSDTWGSQLIAFAHSGESGDCTFCIRTIIHAHFTQPGPPWSADMSLTAAG